MRKEYSRSAPSVVSQNQNVTQPKSATKRTVSPAPSAPNWPRASVNPNNVPATAVTPTTGTSSSAKRPQGPGSWRGFDERSRVEAEVSAAEPILYLA